MKLPYWLILFGMLSSVQAFESLPAIWRHDLSSTKLTGYSAEEFYIVSHIFTGRMGLDAVQQHGLELKVTGFGKAFSTTSKAMDGKLAERFEVTLHETPNPRQIRADYESLVYKNGKPFLRFSGSTLLQRP